MKSNYTRIEGVHIESEGPSTLNKFISKVGEPTGIHNDKSKIQTRKACHEIMRHYCIDESTTEPHHHHHNTYFE